jgi:hypothetical protein
MTWRAKALLFGAVAFMGLGMAYDQIAGTHCRFPPVAASAVRILRSAALEWRASRPDVCPTTGSLVTDGLIDAAVDLEDDWGGAFEITCQGSEVSVRSLGPDRRPGTVDDFVSPRSAR